MNERTRQDVRNLIEARFLEVGNKGLTCCLQREIESMVDMAGLCCAIDIDEQRHFKERLSRMVEQNFQQWDKANRRIG